MNSTDFTRFGAVHELERDPEVGPIGAKTPHALGEAHARDGVGQHVPEHLLEEPAKHVLHDGEDPALVQERGLDVELGEFGLAVRAQVFVAKAAHDLVVTVQARHHEQLLEELRGLRQREEPSRMCAARYQVVTSALRRRARQHRGLDLDEAGIVQVAPQHPADAGAQPEVVLHLGPAQIDVAIAQACFFLDIAVVHLEGGWIGGIEDLELITNDLDLTTREPRVLGAGRAAAYPASHP